MPDPKDNAKQRGDIHPPEVESDLPVEGQAPDALGTEGTPGNRGKAAERGDISPAGRGSRKAGVLQDEGDETRDSDRESGE
jgi:hypothetical protein